MTEYERTVWVINKMIADMQKKLNKAISQESWREVSTLDAYISGMNQILIVVEQSKLKELK